VEQNHETLGEKVSSSPSKKKRRKKKRKMSGTSNMVAPQKKTK
jgi:hypothetical protein